MSKVVKTRDARQAANQQLERDVDRLAASVRKFRIDSQRFFAGDLKVPPDELRERITADFRRLRSASLKGAAANFRLGTLEAQFQSHLDLFGRRLRERELGETRRDAGVEEARLPDPKKGVVLGPKESSAAVEALYRGLYRPDSAMDLERFRSYIHRQAEVIRSKTGCREIQFRIAVQDGKMKLKAKPVRR